MAVLLIFLSSQLGCEGGGGSPLGPAQANAESTEINSRLKGFFAAWQPGSSQTPASFLSRRLAATTDDGRSLISLTFHDMGSDISMPTDDASYTFFLDPSAIVYLSEVLAIVPIALRFPSGQFANIRFQMIKESGVWLIDEIGITIQPGTANPTVFTSAELWPLAMGNRWRLVDVPLVGGGKTAVASFQTFAINRSPTRDANGLSIWTIDESRISGPLSFDRSKWGLATATLVFGTSTSQRSSLGVTPGLSGLLDNPVSAAGWSLSDIIDGGQAHQWRISTSLGLFFHGTDSVFNNGIPWRMTPWLATSGASMAQQLTWVDRLGMSLFADVRTRIAGSALVNLAWTSIDCARVDIGIRLPDSRAIAESWFFAPGLGPVGVAQYDPVSGNVIALRVLLDATVGGLSFGPTTGVPAFTVLQLMNTTPLATPSIDVGISHTFAVSGGASPYTWSIVSGPAWLALDPDSGSLSGKPTATGTFSFTIEMRDANGMTARHTLSWSVAGSTTSGTGTNGVTETGTASGTSTLTGTATATGTDTGSAPSTGAATDTSTGTGTATSTGTSTGTGTGTDTDTDTGTGTGTGTDTDTGTGTGTGTGTDTDTGMGTGSGTGTATTPATVSVSLNSLSPSLTHTSPIPVTIDFSPDVASFTIASITAQGGTVANLQMITANRTFTFDVTPVGQGTVTVGISTGTVRGLDGGANATAAWLVRTFDSVAPVLSMISASPDPTATWPLTVQIDSTELVNNLAINSLTVTNGILGPLIVGNPGRQWTIEITPNLAGVVTLEIATGAVSDAAGNSNIAPPRFVRVFTSDAPTVTLSSTASAQTNLSPISVTASFSKPVSTLALVGINVTNGTPGNLQQILASRSWTFDVTPIVPGTVGIVIATGAVTDQFGTANQASPQLVRAFDNVPPGAVLSSNASTTTNLSLIPMRVSFTEEVATFTAGKLTVTNGTVANFMAVSNATFTFDVVPTASGAVTVQVAAGVVADAAGNGNTVSNLLSRTFDAIQPSVIVSSTASSTTNLSLIPMTVSFTEDVATFTAGKLTVTNGTVANFMAVSNATFTFDVVPTASGAVTVQVAAGVVADVAGNGNTASNLLSRTFDAIQPTVTVSSTASQPTNVSPIPFTVVFSEDVTGFSIGKLLVGNGAAGGFSATDARTYLFSVTPSGQGPVTIDIAANSAWDVASNGNAAAVQASRTYDSVAPGAPTINAVTTPTNVTPQTISGTRDADAVTILVNGSSTGVTYPTGTTWSCQLGLSGGANAINVKARDAADNESGAAASSITLDTTLPTATISSIRVSPTTNLTAIPVTITFSENVSGFSSAGVKVQNGIMSGFTANSATDYSFNLTLTGSGSPLVDVGASAAQDVAGNGNATATQYTCVVTGADGSDVTIDGSVYVLVPRSTLPDGTTVVPAFYCGKYPATAGPANVAGPFYSNDGTYNISGTSANRQAATIGTGYPWVYITQADARTACTAAGCNLISDPQWLSIAHQTMGLAVNWRNGVIGSTEASGGGLYRGLYYPSQSRGQPASGGDIVNPPVSSITYRIKTLPNNAQIWDIGGNILQWVDLTMSASSYTGTAITASWFETNSANLTNVNIKTAYTNAYGVGAIYINSFNDFCGFMRSLSWSFSEAGPFGLYLGLPGTNTNKDIGFRCVRP